jgi:alpha-L-fucosidase 2
MIMQSHTGAIEFLPALPSVFDSGKVTGLCARSGFVVDVNWLNSKLTDAFIFSRLGNDCTIRSANRIEIFDGNSRINFTKNTGNEYSFKTRPGKRYRIRPI